MLMGVFTCFSIVSYIFTWKIDQDKVINSNLFNFLFRDPSIVVNWGGHLGAALSHVLVYKGPGIASFAIGLGIAAIGLRLIYGTRVVPLLRYMRWLSLLLLLAAPVSAYIINLANPNNPSFRYGGRARQHRGHARPAVSNLRAQGAPAAGHDLPQVRRAHQSRSRLTFPRKRAPLPSSGRLGLVRPQTPVRCGTAASNRRLPTTPWATTSFAPCETRVRDAASTR